MYISKYSYIKKRSNEINKNNGFSLNVKKKEINSTKIEKIKINLK